MVEVKWRDYVIICDSEDYELISKSYVCKSGNNYLSVKKKINGIVSIVSRFLMKCEDTKMVVDHINGNSLDLRKSNMRIISPKENSTNIKLKKNQIYFGIIPSEYENNYIVHFESGSIVKRFRSKHEAIKYSYNYVKENWKNEREKRSLEQILEENEEHVYESANVKCYICDKIYFSKKTRDMHSIAMHDPKFIDCEICGKQFNTIYFSKHMKLIHSVDLELECEKCGLKFKNKDYLHKHTLRYHSEENYNCDECDFTTKYKDNLTKHIKNKHSDTKIKCDECDNKFSSRDYLASHKKMVHEKVKEKCPVCDNEYDNHVKMVKHLNRQHKAPKDKYKCDKCNYATNEIGNLKRHMNVD